MKEWEQGDAQASPRNWRIGFAVALGLLLVLQASIGSVVKLAAGQSDDLAHSALHMLSGLAGLLVWWHRSDAAARTFAGGFGAVYLVLAVRGCLGSPMVGFLQLEMADHVFHAVVGTISGSVAALPRRTVQRVAGAPA